MSPLSSIRHTISNFITEAKTTISQKAQQTVERFKEKISGIAKKNVNSSRESSAKPSDKKHQCKREDSAIKMTKRQNGEISIAIKESTPSPQLGVVAYKASSEKNQQIEKKLLNLLDSSKSDLERIGNTLNISPQGIDNRNPSGVTITIDSNNKLTLSIGRFAGSEAADLTVNGTKVSSQQDISFEAGKAYEIKHEDTLILKFTMPET
jgi:hypothetical protein